MATYTFSALADGQSIAFNPATDVLNFDQTAISAADLGVATVGSDSQITADGKSVVLLNTAQVQLASSNITFANGSLLVFGDNTPGTANDGLANTLNGGAGNDLLQGFGGADTMNGGGGNDTYIVGTGDVINDTGGTDTIVTDVSFNISANIENLVMTGTANINSDGNSLVNVMQGNAGNNIFWAGLGNDTLLGGAGNDQINGEAGNDWLDGGTGNDTLNGGGDKDSFVFSSFGTANADHVLNFASAWDDIRFDASSFTALGAAGRFVAGDVRFFAGAGATAGHDADDRIVYNTTTGQVFYDADGNGPGAAQLVATLDGAPTLVASDLWVFGTPPATDQTINGTTGNDTLVGGPGNDTINGLAGNDSLDGQGGNDRLDGGTGNDTITGGAGSDLFVASAAPGEANVDTVLDFISGTDRIVLDGSVLQNAGPTGDFSGADPRFFAGIGVTAAHDADDRVIENLSTGDVYWDPDGTGSAPALRIFNLNGHTASSGDFTVINPRLHLVGTSGDDSLVGGGGDDTLEGLAGNDTLVGNAGNDSLSGGDGNDSLVGGPGIDTLDGGLGNDTYHVNQVDDPNDVFVDAGGVDTVISEGFRQLASGLENLELYNGAGDDGATGIGNELNNIITVHGGSFGGNRVDGGDGNDTIFGAGDTGHSNNQFLFQAGSGDYGNDSIVGGDGFDAISFFDGTASYAHSAVVIDLKAGTLSGGGTNPADGAVFTKVDDATGGAFDDRLVAHDGYMVFTQLGDGPFLRGASLDGREGNDTLVSGASNDTLIGGSGADAFVFGQAPGTASADQVWDFATGTDKIHLDATVMSALGASGNFSAGDARFFAGAGASAGQDADDRVVFDTSTGHLWYDADGSGSGAAQLIATFAAGNVSGNPVLPVNATDIVVDNGTSGGGTINGTAGDDTLTGTPGNDTINGLAGNDSISGLAGDDQLFGGDGRDTLVGGDGNDTLAAHDAAFSGDVGNTLDGGLGDDTYIVALDSTGTDIIAPDPGGHDTVIVEKSDHWTLDAGLEDLTFNVDGGVTGTGNDLDNVIRGGFAGSTLFGMGGNDLLQGRASAGQGGSQLHGGDGNDTLNADDGGDLLVGDAGLDVLNGGNGNDTLDGTSPNPGGPGEAGEADTLSGGLGNDLYIVSTNDVVIDTGGVDTVRAVSTNWTLGNGLENLILVQGGPDFDGASGTGNGLDNLIDASAYDHSGTLLGLGGNDTMFSGQNSGQVFGGDGNDELHGTKSFLSGGLGNDTLYGGGTSVLVFDAAPGAANADTVMAYSGETIQIDGNAFTNIGASGQFTSTDPRFFSGAGANAGHDADDRVIYDTTSGNLWYDADGSGAGSAQLFATLQGAPALNPLAIDVVNGTSGGATITGTSGNDSLTGTNGNDTIDGLGGVDTMNGLLGDDTYFVTAGDVLQDSGGTDTVMSDGNWDLAIGFENITFLGTGNWQSQGNNADNVATGNDGNNYFNMRAGNDTIFGNGGNDTIDMSTGGTSSYGNDVINGGAGADRIDFDGYARTGINAVLTDSFLGTAVAGGHVTGGGDAGAGSADLIDIEQVIGGGFDDTITGNKFDNFLDGRNGNDSITGGAGSDTMLGQNGNDTLEGGAGNDFYSGGAGNDEFIFREAGSANADRIYDFTPGTDKLAFDNAALTAMGADGDFASGDARFFAAAGATAAHDSTDRLVYNTTTGDLYYDADGSGGAAAQLVATLTTHPALAATDITVI